MTSAQPTAKTDSQVSERYGSCHLRALAEPVEIASSEALSAAFAESDSSTPSVQGVEEPNAGGVAAIISCRSYGDRQTEAAKVMVTETAGERDELEETMGLVPRRTRCATSVRYHGNRARCQRPADFTQADY